MNSGQLSLAALSAGTMTRWREAVTVAAAVVLVALVLSVVLPPSYRAMVSFVTTDAGIQLPRGLSDLATQPGVAGLAAQNRRPSMSPS
jgi:uncharacterized protein involved in exopolysaccharide biosynthesis